MAEFNELIEGRSFNETDIGEACRLVRQMLRKNDAREYISGVCRYNRDPRFASLVDLICSDIGLSVPLRYGDDCLVVTASDMDSPFAMRSSFFPKADKKVKPLMLVLLHAAVSSFWKDRNLFGNDEESSWITVDDVHKFITDMANSIIGHGEMGEDSICREIYRMKDIADPKRSSKKNLSGLIKDVLAQMVKVGFAVTNDTDEAATYRATKVLCAHLRSPGWEQFEQFLAEGARKRNDMINDFESDHQIPEDMASE